MFDLDQASEGNVSRSYQKPGVYDNIKISEVVLEKTSKAQVDYMKLVTEGPNGEIGTSVKMFLGNDKEKAEREGKKTTGYGITARNILNLIMATHNVDEATAKSMFKSVSSKEELAQQVSALLVGKPFRAKFKGTTSQVGLVYAELDQVESMRVENTRMKFIESRDIKPYEGPKVANTSETSNSEPVASPFD